MTKIVDNCVPRDANGLTTAWQRVSPMPPLKHPDSQFWWRTSGSALAILLQKADYTIESQCWHLNFYASFIIPQLGPAPKTGSRPPQWKSFMTDDATPIELSWDWGWERESPAIRYSIEPIGPNAGTSADLLNEYAGTCFVHQLNLMFPDTNLEWFGHFSKELLTFSRHDGGHLSPEGHESRFFIAFDLHESNIVLKAYFFPAFKATETGVSKLAIVSQAISSLPNCQPSSFPAFDVLCDYLQTAPTLEVEIVAVVCMTPSRARTMIYIQSPFT